MSTSISGSSAGNLLSQHGNPGNPTEMEAFAAVVVVVDASTHTTGTHGVVVGVEA